jgi:hypothetical protein
MSLTKSESARITDSRAGAKSRGPQYPAGKARSSRNAIQHGICAQVIVLSEGNASLFEEWELQTQTMNSSTASKPATNASSPKPSARSPTSASISPCQATKKNQRNELEPQPNDAMAQPCDDPILTAKKNNKLVFNTLTIRRRRLLRRLRQTAGVVSPGPEHSGQRAEHARDGAGRLHSCQSQQRLMN